MGPSRSSVRTNTNADAALARATADSRVEYPAWCPAPSPGAMFSLADLPASARAAIEIHARQAALDAGRRPRHDIVIADSLADYEQLVGAPALEVAGGRRGLCGPGPAGARVIWVAPAPHADFLETLTHEYAHAVLPIRDNHTLGWLEVHLATLALVTSPCHASAVQQRCVTQYGLSSFGEG